MPFIKDIVDDATGVEYQGAYFWPMEFKVNYPERVIAATFLGHKNMAAQAAGKASLYSQNGPIRKEYELRGDAFVALLQQIAATPEWVTQVNALCDAITAGQDVATNAAQIKAILAALPPLPLQIAGLLDQVALQTKDQTGPNGEPVSFFENAQRVQPDLAVL